MLCAPLLILITHPRFERYIQKAIANTINVRVQHTWLLLLIQPRDNSINQTSSSYPKKQSRKTRILRNRKDFAALIRTLVTKMSHGQQEKKNLLA